MEDVVQFDDIYRNKRVLVTGHTGFKGSWFCLWLKLLGADVLGYALPPDTDPSHFVLLENQLNFLSVFGDIRDFENLKKTVAEFEPEIIFHFAAQPIVRRSYCQPIETLQTNIIGTAHVFEACRTQKSVRVIINVTSDKCYENKEWVWGYRENDPMGGYDPYSASKGCAELVTSAYRNSFFNCDSYGIDHHILLASVRAGNVIGGGDWSKDRIVTDMMTAAGKGETFFIRYPQATRPWQHVLDPLSGYLLLGQALLKGKKEYAGAWNFGPNDDGEVSVLEIVMAMQQTWQRITYAISKEEKKHHEASLLKLDCSKARTLLSWKVLWDTQTTCTKTVQWYKAFYEQDLIITMSQLETYIQNACQAGVNWVCQRDLFDTQAMIKLQESSGFMTNVLADENEDIWNDL